MEFSLDWILFKLSSVVWIRFELSKMLDSKSELSGALLHDGLSAQSISLEREFSKVFFTSCFGMEDEGWIEIIVSLIRRLCNKFLLVAQLNLS